jgi:hypothetical protein
LRATFARINKLALFVGVAFLATALAYATDTTTSPAPQPSTGSAHHSTKSTHSSHKGKKSHTAASRKRGQQKIDSERAQQIQQALVREHYLSGKPSGVWDTATQEAMQKYQADNGWQSKTTPDSRALIKLGLGPDQQHLLNPESAMTSDPQATHAVPPASKTPNPADPGRPQN